MTLNKVEIAAIANKIWQELQPAIIEKQLAFEEEVIKLPEYEEAIALWKERQIKQEEYRKYDDDYHRKMKKLLNSTSTYNLYEESHVRNAFKSKHKFISEINLDSIRNEVILANIGSPSVDALVETVKNKFIN